MENTLIICKTSLTANLPFLKIQKQSIVFLYACFTSRIGT